MDDRQFDRWTLSLTERLSRRGLGRLGAGVLAALGLDAITTTEPNSLAKPNKRRTRRADDRQVSRRADKPSSQVSAEKKKKGKKKKAPCRPNCSGKNCGSNGCPGGSCGQCIGGEICSDQSSGGVCECPRSAECSSACCTTDETCLGDACCPTVRECDGACCEPDETCINDICEPTSGQPLIVCAPCGECWQCDGDSESGAVSCPASCADECHARTLCNQAKDVYAARRLARYARDAGYVQVGEPSAVRFTTDGGDAAAEAVVLYHIHVSQRTWRAEFIYRVDAEGAVSAYLALLDSNRLTDLLIVDGEGDVVPIRSAGSSPRQRQRRAGERTRSLDEPYTLSPMGCSVCQTLLLGSGALALAGSAVALAGVNFYIAVSWRTAAATATPAPLALKEELALLHLDTFFAIMDASREDPCALVGNCCFSGQRLCPRFNPIDGSECKPEAECCDNGVEGKCPGDGDTCFDFRTSPQHCGGCAGGSLGQNCSDALGVHAEFTTCDGGTCDYGNCKERGAPYDPSDTSQNGCCRKNDKGRPCRRVGQEGSDWMCAGYSVPDDDDICCVDDVCPSDPDPNNPRCGCHGRDWGYAASFYTFPIRGVCGNCAACGGNFGYHDTYVGIRTFCASEDTGEELSCQPTHRPVCPGN